MKHIIVGTAGHVDHGKTALIEALSGYAGDTLEEEKKRGITINLSFSNLQNDNTNVAFIDVPGHEKLLKNMIAGAFGFDACMVIIDANEGIMPQTTEHLEILNLLHVKSIIIALTKSDLVTPSEVEERKKEIQEYFKTFSYLSLKSIIPVSIYDKDSIKNLKQELFSIPIIEKPSNGLFRYYIDRSFSLAGVGTVVTGTVLDGTIKIGEKVFAPELEKEIVVKNLQVHDKDEKEALSSQRTAINLQNTKVNLKKGTLLCKKGFIRGFTSVDVWVEGISNQTIKHNTQVILFIGTKQIETKILLYSDENEISSGLAKLQFHSKIFLVHNEPFIICRSGKTIGGGRVLNPINDPIKKKIKMPLLEALKNDDFKTAFEILVNTHKRGFGIISSNQRFGLNHDEALKIAHKMENVFVDEKGLVIYPLSIKKELKNKINAIYEKNEYALLSANSLSLKIKWASESLLNDVLQDIVKSGQLDLKDGIYKNPNINVNNIDKIIEEKMHNILQEEGFMPTAPYNIYDELDIDRKMGDDALKRLTKSQKVVRLAHNLFVTTENLSIIITRLREIMKNEGSVDINSFRKFYDMSRKYLVAYLDYLDLYDDVKKDGMKRVLV
ncbi:selenocysteine-specific translation elongation factor [Sulfurospirillum arcachonense]|uniref:selenocysteine-specific translation elongation factor n=1 Tax=Sulfurospirillum arcachonense TaxID=57666 RepID=UPI000469ABCA|nr:selenocysteine-specific translation elongation factor [Sulfurospirillum arcachonense]